MKSASAPTAKKEGTVDLHETVGNELAEAGAGALCERCWSWVGRTFAAITRATSPVPFWAHAACTLTLVLLVDFGLTLATQRDLFRRFVYEDILWAAFTLCFLLLMRWQFLHHLDVLRHEVLPHLPAGDLADVRRWMRWLQCVGLQWATSILAGALGAICSFLVITQGGTQAIGAGQVFLHFMDFLLMGMLAYDAVPFILLYNRIGNYRFQLYTLNPSHSAVLIAMYNLANGFSLVFAAMVALFMMLVTRLYPSSLFLAISFMPIVLFNWVPILLLFAISQRAFSRIILRVKRQKLAELQQRISQIEASVDMSKKPTVDLMKGLLDYYQRVADTPNSMLNVQVALNLVTSLILPLLGLLLSSYAQISKMLGLQR